MNWDVDTDKGLAVGLDGITFSYKRTVLTDITNIPQWAGHKDLYMMIKEVNLIYLSEYKNTVTEPLCSV